MATLTLLVKGSSITAETNGMTNSNISGKANQTTTVTDGGNNPSLVNLVPLNIYGKGHVTFEIHDKNGATVASLSTSFDSSLNGVELIRIGQWSQAGGNVAFEASGRDNSMPNALWYRARAAEFSTGKIVIKAFGKIDTIHLWSDLLGVGNVFNGAAFGNGTYELTIPFEISEA